MALFAYIIRLFGAFVKTEKEAAPILNRRGAAVGLALDEKGRVVIWIRYSMCYLDLCERIERVEYEAVRDREAVSAARAICAERKRAARAAYAAKGIFVKIRKGYYVPLNVRNESTDSSLLA